jgi:hypothetical protein
MRTPKVAFLPLVVFATGLLAVSCTGKSKTDHPAVAETQAPSPAWAAKMHQLSQTLSDLLPLVASRAKFAEEKNLPRVEADTRALRSLAHDLNAGPKPSADPGMKMMSARFEEDLDRALESLKTGNRDYARNILKDSTAYCIQCHTASQNGPEFTRLNLNINLSELNALERAEFFTATRQFDNALAEYKKIIADEPVAQADPFEWERAARSALAIIVRVKNDPQAAGDILSQIRQNPRAPKSTQEALPSWTKSVREWAKEKPAKSKTTKKATPAANTPEAQLATAETLINKAQKGQEYPLDHSQDILYFRASSLLSDFLAHREESDALTAKALYLAGIASEATRDMNFWTLHETYYERCIQADPHSPLARQCYARYADSITLGYSGSGGVRIPPEVGRHLAKLKALAE